MRKRRPNPGVSEWLGSVDAGDLYLSVLVVAEVRQGVERLRRHDPVQAAVFDHWLLGLHRDYARRILPVTAQIAEEWGRLNAQHRLPVIDGLLAATAKVEELTLVARASVEVLDPFTGRAG